MRRVGFVASAMSVASLTLIAGAQNAAAVPAGAGAAAVKTSSVRKAPFTRVQGYAGYGGGYGGLGYGGGYGGLGYGGYGDPFDRWKHLPGWDSYDDAAYLPSPCCGQRPCCDPPPPPPPPQPCCAPRPYIAPPPYVPPVYTPLK